MKKNFILIVGFLMLIMLVVSACGGAQDTQGTPDKNNAGNTGSNSAPKSEPAETVTLKFGFGASPEHTIYKEVVMPFVKEVEEATEGRVQFDMYPGGALAKSPQQYEAMVSGTLDVAHLLPSMTPGQMPLGMVLHLPFMAEGNSEHMSVIAQKLWHQSPGVQEDYKKAGIRPLWFSSTAPGVIMTKGVKVDSLDDLKGLKLRTPSPEVGALVKAWGATPVTFSITQLYDALEKGVVDGTVTATTALLDFGLIDLVDYITYGDYNATTFVDAISLSAWNKISPEDQEAIKKITEEKYSQMAGKAFDGETEEIMKKAQEAGIEFVTLSDEELKKFKAPAQGIRDKWIADKESKGLAGQEVYDKALELLDEK